MLDIEYHALDLLVDGPSSFAALFHGLRVHWKHWELSVIRLLGIFKEMETRGLVRASQMSPDGTFRDPIPEDYENAVHGYSQWLPHATASDVAIDEVGLWFRLTEKGRREWTQWTENHPEGRDYWQLDDLVEQGVLEIRAENQDMAVTVLEKWLAEHREVRVIPQSRVSIEIPSFVMRDGTRIANGVLLTYRYRKGNT